MTPALGNDRFLNSASPVDTTKPALDDFGHGVWWPLALDDMPEECAQFAAQVFNALKSAQKDAWLAQRRAEQTVSYASTPGSSKLKEVQPMTWLYEMTEALSDGRTQYFRDLIEAIYTA